MRYGRKICKELFVILYVFIFLVSDPKLVRACSMINLPDTSKETITSDDVTFDFFDTQDPSEYHNLYEVNGGINNNKKKKNTRYLLSLHNIRRNRAGIFAESPIMEQAPSISALQFRKQCGPSLSRP